MNHWFSFSIFILFIRIQLISIFICADKYRWYAEKGVASVWLKTERFLLLNSIENRFLFFTLNEEQGEEENEI